jgi:hypothetical protein
MGARVTPRRIAALLALAMLAALGSASVAGAQPGSHLLVIVGLGGDLENSDRFHQWASTIVDAARGRYGLASESVVYLGEDPARDPKRLGGRSTREAIAAAVDRVARTARPGDTVFIVLIGHGASATGGARFNLPGPDLTAAEYASLLNRFAGQTAVFVNTASSSGGFVQALSGRNRVIVTATTSDGERNQTRFGEFFAEAFTADGADGDKDGRVSALEAFNWARTRVADSYKRDGQLLTEHAVLDDNGDGKGAAAPEQPGGDGALARTLFMSAAAAGRAIPDQADPELRALVAQRDTLEARIAALRAAKDKTDPMKYEADLEGLLIDLARVNRSIREKQK